MIDPNDYWVNNPLITPINKALIYDNAIWNAKEDEKERIINLLEGRLQIIKEQGNKGRLTAMRRQVELNDAVAITEAIIYAIKGEQK